MLERLMKMKKWSSQWTQLMQLRKQAWKKIQNFNGVWTRDFAITSTMLYQLSYEATDVGSRSIVDSYVPVNEMSVNDIWSKSYMNCGKWKWRNDRRSERNLYNCVKKPEKKKDCRPFIFLRHDFK